MNSALRRRADTSTAATMPERLGLSLLILRTAVRIRTVESVFLKAYMYSVSFEFRRLRFWARRLHGGFGGARDACSSL
eukprot:1567918-Prymnesium_polylepis.1